MKWWWRYAQERTSIWKELVNIKYGRHDRWNTKQNNDPYGVGPWKYVNKLREEFFQEVSFRIGHHNSIKFWEDSGSNSEDGIWVPRFRRNFQHWELNEL